MSLEVEKKAGLLVVAWIQAGRPLLLPSLLQFWSHRVVQKDSTAGQTGTLGGHFSCAVQWSDTETTTLW